ADLSQHTATEALEVKQGQFAASENPLTWIHFDETMAQLNGNNLFLQADALLTDEGQPSPLFAWIIKEGKAGKIFTEDNWKGASKEEVRAVMRHVPEDQQARIPNRHQLLASAQTSQLQ